MNTIQSGAWRTSAGEYKVFIRGCEQLEGTTAEVISYAGKVTYAVTKSTHSKISGGYLYNFYCIRKPEPTPSSTTTINAGEPQPKTSTVGAEISAEELNVALGLD